MNEESPAEPVVADQVVDRGWLHRFAEATRLFTQGLVEQRNTCVLTTRIGLAVLESQGVRARPQPVFVTVANRRGFEMHQNRVPVERWPSDAWAVGIDERSSLTGKDSKSWNGHLVLVVRLPGEPRLLIDLTADQFDRPAKGMVVGGPVFMGIASEWSPQDPLSTVIGGPEDGQWDAIVTYRPMPPGHHAFATWRDSADWNLSAEVVESDGMQVLGLMEDLARERAEGEGPAVRGSRA